MTCASRARLFGVKESDVAKREKLLELLRKRQVSKKSRNMLEKPIDEKELRSAIRSLAVGKAPGPDGLRGNFIKNLRS